MCNHVNVHVHCTCIILCYVFLCVCCHFLTNQILICIVAPRHLCHLLSLQHVVTSEAITLLPQYFGTYRLTVNNAETYWMVMRSVFSSSLKMHRKFDLKGSTVDRLASDKEKVVTHTALVCIITCV